MARKRGSPHSCLLTTAFSISLTVMSSACHERTTDSSRSDVRRALAPTGRRWNTPYEPERGTFEELSLGAAWRDADVKALAHAALRGNCGFIPFPPAADMLADVAQWAAGVHASRGGKDAVATTTVFVGQMSFDLTELQVAWLCYAFGALTVGSVKPITHKVKTMGRRGGAAAGGKIKMLPTGGFHVTCDGETAAWLAQAMHKRVLVDASGVWVAATPRDKCHMDAHVAALHANAKLRTRGVPYESVVVQAATSTRTAAQ